MSLVGFKGKNHPQQLALNGARDDVDDRGTPPELFDPLNERFGFTVDVAAAPHNAKCERYYTIADDGLTQPWAGERVWCNPPYNARDLALFVAKAWHEWETGLTPLIVMLVPANRPEQAWWQDHVEPFRDRGGASRSSSSGTDAGSSATTSATRRSCRTSDRPSASRC